MCLTNAFSFSHIKYSSRLNFLNTHFPNDIASRYNLRSHQVHMFSVSPWVINDSFSLILVFHYAKLTRGAMQRGQRTLWPPKLNRRQLCAFKIDFAISIFQYALCFGYEIRQLLEYLITCEYVILEDTLNIIKSNEK